ncbi:SulP family inorganic anion transporter [Sorangium sp. So ce131]|uniref:SulP family inorganic anion transporter n=1 Tax=Sorangium sp. So ce131 TaxID=3133282 RepID=UPI003F5E4BEE
MSEARRDLQAAVTVAVISLPQSMAYALVAGVDPRFGLYTAIVFTAVASILGSSSHLINGPTGAVSLVTFSALSFIDPEARLDAYEAMFLLSAMIGVIQIAISLLRFGDLTRYISESVITGFMSGAAILTIVGQIASALGLRSQGTGHQHVFHRLWLTLTQGGAISGKALAISAGSVVLSVIARKLVRRYKLPQLDTFLVLLAVCVCAYLLGWSRPGATGKAAVALIEEVPASLPRPHIPEIEWTWLGKLSSGAFAIALLGLLETLAIAKAIAHKTRETLDLNRQCLAEGVGNLTGAFFRCQPGAGSLSRSAINYQAGAATKLSGVYTAGFVAVMVLLLAPLTHYIPKAALAGLLVVAAARLIDVERLRYVVRASRYDAALLALTWLSALVIGVEFAILIGVGFSLVLFVPRAAKLKRAELVVTDERVVRERTRSDPRCTAVSIHDLEGELFFGAAPELERHLDHALRLARSQGTRCLVMRLKRLRNPDAVCLELLERFLRGTSTEGVAVFLAGVRPDLLSGMQRLRFGDWFPMERCFMEADDDEDSATLKAVRKAYDLLGPANTCEHCAALALSERPVGAAAYYLV